METLENCPYLDKNNYRLSTEQAVIDSWEDRFKNVKFAYHHDEQGNAVELDESTLCVCEVEGEKRLGLNPIDAANLLIFSACLNHGEEEANRLLNLVVEDLKPFKRTVA